MLSRRRRCCATTTPRTSNWRWPGWCTTWANCLPGARDETHATDAAAAVRGALGERVAGIVALHVEAKRYLVATEANYLVRLTDDSVVSLGRQGGILDPGQASAFLTLPWAPDAVTLRRADDGAKVLGLEVAGLEEWVPLLRQM